MHKDGLTRGDIGTVVLVHQEGKGYEVEVTTPDGETVAIVTLTANQVRPSKPREIAHVRDLAANPSYGMRALQRPDGSRGGVIQFRSERLLRFVEHHHGLGLHTMRRPVL